MKNELMTPFPQILVEVELTFFTVLTFTFIFILKNDNVDDGHERQHYRHERQHERFMTTNPWSFVFMHFSEKHVPVGTDGAVPQELLPACP